MLIVYVLSEAERWHDDDDDEYDDDADADQSLDQLYHLTVLYAYKNKTTWISKWAIIADRSRFGPFPPSIQ